MALLLFAQDKESLGIVSDLMKTERLCAFKDYDK